MYLQLKNGDKIKLISDGKEAVCYPLREDIVDYGAKLNEIARKYEKGDLDGFKEEMKSWNFEDWNDFKSLCLLALGIDLKDKEKEKFQDLLDWKEKQKKLFP